MIEFYRKLREDAKAHDLKRSRVILTQGFDMVICLHRDSRVGMHRHPKYEAYHILEGKMRMRLADREVLHDHSNPMVIIQAGTWHEPLAETKYVIYREFYCGPFEKARDVEYQ